MISATTIRRAMCLGAAATLLAVAAQGQVLRLRSGKFLLGQVTDATESGVRFKRLDNGGVLELRWSEVNAGDAKAIRRKFHLLGDEQNQDVLMEATKLRFVKRAGGGVREFTGELVSRAGNVFVLRKKGLRVTVPLAELRGVPETVLLPIQELLTPDEIYQRKLSEIAPGEDANKHLQFGVYLIRVGDYARAKTHVDKAKELGGGDQPREVEAQLKRVESLIANKVEADLISQMNTLRNRKHFAKALEIAKQYEQEYATSGKLKAEFGLRKKQLMEARETWLVREVAGAWYRALRDEAGKIARTTTDFEAARTKAEEELGQSIRARVARLKKITPEEAEAFFKMRIARKVAKRQVATYSTGSWILGKQKIIEGTPYAKGGKQAGKKQSQQDKLRRELQKRMQEWLRRSRRGSRGGGGAANQGAELQTEAEWWKDVPSTTRQLWLMAFYAENSGDVEVVGAAASTCPQCGSKGFLEILNAAGGKPQRRDCPLCHGTQFLRGVRFR